LQAVLETQAGRCGESPLKASAKRPAKEAAAKVGVLEQFSAGVGLCDCEGIFGSRGLFTIKGFKYYGVSCYKLGEVYSSLIKKSLFI
jgi:hypothetical protein